MVKAGEVVDQTIEQVLPYLEKGDILIDGGNSLYTDSTRRTKDLASKGILFIGTGVSGGEEGARFGPSIMPGGNKEAWPHVKEIFQAIAAKVEDGTPCCDWVGEDGAGHYVKMVHNGIEYGDMQLIGEAYQLLKDGLGLTADELAAVFAEWNKGELDSFLIDISATIFAKKDDDGQPMVDKILDAAGQKGTGKWTAISARAGKGGKGTERTSQAKKIRWTERVHRGSALGSLLLQNGQLCAGVYVAASGRDGPGLEFEYGRRGADVARRLHHSEHFPGRHQSGLRQGLEAAEPAVG
jgi:6-phosphogluconate dehydrogenase (decarboxylating)